MSSITGIQPRTFSWLTDEFRECLSFQQTYSRDRDGPVSVSDTPQLILKSDTTAAKEKKDTGAAISQKEWTVLAFSVQQGAECPPNRQTSHESVVGILQAFQAAYKPRKPGGDEGKVAYYLDKLNSMDQDEDAIEVILWIVPAGATLNMSNTVSVDESHVKPVPRNKREEK